MNLRLTLIDESAGLRHYIATLIRQRWPQALINEVVPSANVPLACHPDSQLLIMGEPSPWPPQPGLPPVLALTTHPDQDEKWRATGAISILPKATLSQDTLLHAIADRLGIPWQPASFAGDAVPFRFNLNGTLYAPAIAHYQKPILLTSGPQAQTFYAERQSDGLPVVVKIITSSPLNQELTLAPFCKRYAFFSGLQGLSTVRFLDAGIAHHWPYVVLEYLAAGNLRQRIEAAETGMTPAVAVHVLLHLLTALSCLHAGQYAHLDLKPENIAFRQSDGGQNSDAVLIDFDAAYPFGHTARHDHAGAVLGTPSYMSPEQALGQVIDGRSDLYSCGVIFYEMLTGKKPYVGESDAQVVYKHLHDDIPLLPKPLRSFQAILDKLMAKDRDERYPDCTTLATDLLPFLTVHDRTYSNSFSKHQ
ncbi:MAG: serine/threonine protein kinase [Betaproteobacteria bacterium]|nr:serine/threonine protein kinase [Betaproteobacteria bacterium]